MTELGAPEAEGRKAEKLKTEIGGANAGTNFLISHFSVSALVL
jgi:hypothetical protein